MEFYKSRDLLTILFYSQLFVPQRHLNPQQHSLQVGHTAPYIRCFRWLGAFKNHVVENHIIFISLSTLLVMSRKSLSLVLYH